MTVLIIAFSVYCLCLACVAYTAFTAGYELGEVRAHHERYREGWDDAMIEAFEARNRRDANGRFLRRKRS